MHRAFKQEIYFFLTGGNRILRLCLATYNFKWLEITHICLIWDQTLTNLNV